jgi:type I restriction enzyme R subunit
MHAIARVDRVFQGKPGGLIVDYIGHGDQLKEAQATYTEAGGQGNTGLDQAEAVAMMREKDALALAPATQTVGLGHGPQDA